MARSPEKKLAVLAVHIAVIALLSTDSLYNTVFNRGFLSLYFHGRDEDSVGHSLL